MNTANTSPTDEAWDRSNVLEPNEGLVSTIAIMITIYIIGLHMRTYL